MSLCRLVLVEENVADPLISLRETDPPERVFRIGIHQRMEDFLGRAVLLDGAGEIALEGYDLPDVGMGITELIPPREILRISFDQPQLDLKAHTVAFKRFVYQISFNRFVCAATFSRRQPVAAKLRHGKQHTTDSVVYERPVPLPDGVFRFRLCALR